MSWSISRRTAKCHRFYWRIIMNFDRTWHSTAPLWRLRKTSHWPLFHHNRYFHLNCQGLTSSSRWSFILQAFKLLLLETICRRLPFVWKHIQTWIKYKKVKNYILIFIKHTNRDIFRVLFIWILRNTSDKNLTIIILNWSSEKKLLKIILLLVQRSHLLVFFQRSQDIGKCMKFLLWHNKNI